MLGSKPLFGSSACSGAASLEQRRDDLPQSRCWLAKHDEIDYEEEGNKVAELLRQMIDSQTYFLLTVGQGA
jgi:hypothetical protein